MVKAQKEEENHGWQQAEAQLTSIKEMMKALNEAESDEAREQAEARIQEDPLSIQVRSDWYSPGQLPDAQAPAEFTILLCTGGPAVRIIGTLGDHHEPDKARIEHQDWFKPWTDYPLDSEEEEIVLEYCQQFYFG